MTKEFENECENLVEAYANERTKRAIERVERFKKEKDTALVTKAVAVDLANSWLYFMAPDKAEDFYYRVSKRGTIFQEIELKGKRK